MEYAWLGAVKNLNNSGITHRSPIPIFSNFYKCDLMKIEENHNNEDHDQDEHCAPSTQEASQLAFCRKKLRKIGRCEVCDTGVSSGDESQRAQCMSECLTCITETCHEVVCRIRKKSGKMVCKSKDYYKESEEKFYSRIRRTLKHMCPILK